jgi:hypothetical protein
VAERKRFFSRHRTLAALFVVALINGACSSERENPEKQVRSLLEQGETAAEHKQAGALRQMISERYSDSQGQDKKAIEAILRYYFLRNESIHLLTRIQQIVVSKLDTAQAIVLVAMAGQPISGPDELDRIRADVYRFELSLSREDGEWKVSRAEWRRTELADFL